jgi:PAS domain S-box-containing protein
MKIFMIYCHTALSSSVLKRALVVAAVVGSILNLINQGWQITHADWTHINYIKMGLTFLVPYLVSTYSSTKAKLSFKVSEVSSMDAVLQCKSCGKSRIYINKGEIVPACHTCGQAKTNWKIVERGYNQHRHIDNDYESMALFAKMNPAPVVRFDDKGIITKSNTAAQNAFETTSLEGESITTFVPPIKDIELKSFIQNGDIKSVKSKNSAGLMFRFELRGLPQYGAVQMYGADITEIITAQTEINRFHTGLEQTSNSIMITNTKGEIEYVNSAFEYISGYRKEEVLGQNPRFLKTGHTSEEEYKTLWRTISKGEVWKGEMLNRRKDGSTYWEESTISPVMNESGEIDSYIAIKEDITEKRAIKQDLESMALFANLNPEPVFRFKSDGEILKSNPAANLAFEMETIEGENIEEFVPMLKEVDCDAFINEGRIEIIEAAIHERVFRFILRGLKDLQVVQTYGSDITKRKQAEEKVLQQKQSIESSIQYASRIQSAVLPSQNNLKSRFKDSFILYKPRDVVSGDFYWMKQTEDKTIVVASDCTGHGVPGAFMSMLGVALLNEIVNKNPDCPAGEILDNLRKNLKTTLSQNNSKGDPKDGMDMSLVIVEHEKMTMQFAGAYNGIYLMRGGELIEYKADKMPIGTHIKEKPHFTSHDIELKKDDEVFMLSDGFPDQFGGEKYMKFSKKRFKELIVSQSGQPMSQQKENLDKAFIDWKGSNDQIDDVLVIGFRV